MSMTVETFLGNENEQRRVKAKNRQDEKDGDKKIKLEKKILDIQIKNLSAEQRLVKSRYINMVKRTRANQISATSERKK